MKKGTTNNPKGRPKGIPNKTTKQMKEALMAALGPELDQLPATLAQMEPSERINALAKLIGYILPKATDMGEAGDVSKAIADAVENLRVAEESLTDEQEANP
jgi:hypothetical protein